MTVQSTWSGDLVDQYGLTLDGSGVRAEATFEVRNPSAGTVFAASPEATLGSRRTAHGVGPA